MYYILSKNKVTGLILQPAKIDKEGNVYQEPIRIEFDENFTYQTDDEDIIARFKKLKNWGADYCLVDRTPIKVVASPNITVTGTDTPDEKRENRLNKLESDVKNLVGAVGQLVNLIKPKEEKKPREKKEEPEETPIVTSEESK